MPQIYETISQPEKEIKENPNYEVVDRVEYEDGIRVYLQGHPYPIFGLPTPEAIQAINVVKKILTFRLLDAAETAIQPFRLKTEYMHPCSQELKRIFTGRVGHLIAQVIEYDAAYRLRLQDLLSQTNKEALSHRPIREILRLLKLNKQRDYDVVHKKIRFATAALILWLLYPPNKSYFKQAIASSLFWKLQLSEADRYWLEKRIDYDARTP